MLMLLSEFDELLRLVKNDKNQTFEQAFFTPEAINRAFDLACGTGTRLDWLNTKSNDFSIRPVF